MTSSKFQRWEELSKIQTVDMKGLSREDLKKLFYEVSTILDIPLDLYDLGHWFVGYGLMSTRSHNENVANLLIGIQKKVPEILEAIYLLKKQSHENVTFTLSWDSCSHAVFTDTESCPDFGAYSDSIILYGEKSVIDPEGKVAIKPKRVVRVELKGYFLPLLNDIKHINLSMFYKCEACGQIYFHWRKRTRKYCSKTCQNRAGVNRHRQKEIG
jgi:hypothetical protein